MAVRAPIFNDDEPGFPADDLELAVERACVMVARADVRVIRSARIVGGRRLGASELLRLQSTAVELGVRLTMDGSGAVAIRRRGEGFE
jgi:hypothetical protein